MAIYPGFVAIRDGHMGGAGGAVAPLVLARLYILTIFMESRSPSFLVKFFFCIKLTWKSFFGYFFKILNKLNKTLKNGKLVSLENPGEYILLHNYYFYFNNHSSLHGDHRPAGWHFQVFWQISVFFKVFPGFLLIKYVSLENSNIQFIMTMHSVCTVLYTVYIHIRAN